MTSTAALAPVDEFYAGTLARLVREGLVSTAARTLVVAGGYVDRDALLAAGFTHVVISNLDDGSGTAGYEPYGWSLQDAEALGFGDGEFEQVIVHAGLHHCRSPHRALLEMYRVASRAVVVFEARDSLAMRLALRARLAQSFEVEAVVAHGLRQGGVGNSELPNFVYRWTEREVIKTLASHDPTGPIPVRFFYGLRLPTARLGMGRSRWKGRLVAALSRPAQLLVRLLPKQGNEFAFVVGKPQQPWPWITDLAAPEVSATWAEERYAATVPDPP